MIPKHLKEKLANQHGIALVVVLMVVVILSVLGLSLLALSTNNFKQTTMDREYQETYYIAESGVTATLNTIGSRVQQLYNDGNFSRADEFFSNVERLFPTASEVPKFEKTVGSITPTVDVKIEPKSTSDSTKRTYKITSKGTIGSRTRTVEREFSITWVPKNSFEIPTDIAAFVDTTIDLSEGGKIYGKVATNSSIKDSISLAGGAFISDDIFVGPGASSNVIKKPNWMDINNQIYNLRERRTFIMPEFPVFPNYPVHQNSNIHVFGGNSYTLTLSNSDWSLDTIKVDNYQTLFINVGDSNRSIVVNDINLDGHIKLIGQGSLTIYVKNNIVISGGSINSDKSTQKLTIFLKGSNNPSRPKTFRTGGEQKINGSLFAEDANIIFTEGSGFYGHVVTGGKSIEISGGSSSYTRVFYAPNANFKLLQGGSLKGIIVAKSLKLSGGTNITFANSTETFPFYPDKSDISLENIIEAKPIRESK
ncbi:DUF7305 domain-containing protein [Metabacillus malikii]|uniref:Type II secretory pathway pseudopilin PulG n=1 Tax=Metabacillus malikii TaxID=1504265 RepID=A0ABT9ZKI8_9BACI|nr:PilX N-terminal domain-containing pilus assembly protein [Metabacillus malikii]MDQ0232809.1 type II secretory pathway pseudopilin PulG [Metabacillus malikii]